MTTRRLYPPETLDSDSDNGTMVSNVETLEAAVVGHRIIAVEKDVPIRYNGWAVERATVITLDNGVEVKLRDTDDCCAFTELREFLLHPERVQHAIMGVGTTNGYTRWHIYADAGDILELTVGWSCGNPFYYGYGFDIDVEEIPTVDDDWDDA